MPRLILINGAPGVGRSTVVRRIADGRPLALVLDVDVVRSLLGDGGPDVTASWLAAPELAVAMARVHLHAGHDVVVPQYPGRPEFLERLAAVAEQARVPFGEAALVTGPGPGRARFDARGAVPQRAGAVETWEQMHARLDALLAVRPHALRVDASGDVDTTVARVRAALGPDDERPSRGGPAVTG